jgi:ribosomal protein S6
MFLTMSDTTMPATEAAVDTADEVVSYELAFHVLPTVAEGEVPTVEEAIKSLITTAGGTLGAAEAAQRFDLAYELQKMIDGKYRRFTTSYFGWVRFTATPNKVTEVLAEVEALPEVLRALMVRLTRQEEANPFYLHEALAARKQVTDVDVSASAPAPEATEPAAEAAPEAKAEATEEEAPAAEATEAPAPEADAAEELPAADASEAKAEAEPEKA